MFNAPASRSSTGRTWGAKIQKYVFYKERNNSMKIDGKEVLILHLKTKWWQMIKSGEKNEEYRRLTPYWTNRLTETVPYTIEVKDQNGNIIARNMGKKGAYKKFDEVWLLCGYPKLTEIDKIIKWKNPTVEIREGFPEWGAPENESVFVIKGVNN